MKMVLHTLRLLFILLITIGIIKAQDTTSFFPHNIGDMWEYWFCYDPLTCDILQVKVIFDSTGPDGNKYIIKAANMIEPFRPPELFFNDTNYYVIDTLNGVYFSENDSFPAIDNFPDNQGMIYKLDAQLDEWWIVEDMDGYFKIGEVVEIEEQYSSEYPTILKTISYLYGSDTSQIEDPSLWIESSVRILSDRFGLTWIGGGDTGGEIYLKGAVIDGILYGDTTHVLKTDDKSWAISPTRITILQNYPNPFNLHTKIRFILNNPVKISLSIYDIIGREIARLYDKHTLLEGLHEKTWNGRSSNGNTVSSGIYFYQLQFGAKTLVGRMVLIR